MDASERQVILVHPDIERNEITSCAYVYISDDRTDRKINAADPLHVESRRFQIAEVVTSWIGKLVHATIG